MLFLFVFLVSLKSTYSNTNFQKWSPDGMKDLWCPSDTGCFQKIEIEKDHCCACQAVPSWELPIPEKLNTLDVEIMDVKGKHNKLLTRNSNDKNPNYSFVHVNGNLNQFPENACNFGIVKIDVTKNRFTEIDDISCFVELDTLIMKSNLISYVSNQTFLGLGKLRTVDLSYNLIQSLDYDLFGDISINILKYNIGGNILHELDVSNFFIVNKTLCGGSYANNKKHLQITNIGNLLGVGNKGTLCGDFNFSNVSISEHPVSKMLQDIGLSELYKYLPCGQGKFSGSAYVCDCDVGDLMNFNLDTFHQIYLKELKESYCEKPESLTNMTIDDVYNNNTLRDLMICDIVDNCPRNGNCKCQCTSQPNQHVLIVDCSNQSCTDFPEVVPKTQHDIILNMSYNNIRHVHTRHDYFEKVKVLDMTENPVSLITSNISTLNIASSVILVNHVLVDLPKQIQTLNPNIFRFGKNGIPCNCDNRWIGDWRKFKRASRQLPLYCSNYRSTLFEDLVNNFPACDTDEISYWAFSIIVPIIVTLLALGLLRCFRYDLIILKRKLFRSKQNMQKTWEIDIYISFDEESKELRHFVISMLEPFFRRKGITTYIPCRDAWPGTSEESNVTSNMFKCKYFLLILSSEMYNSECLPGNTRRLEYKQAWNSFVNQQLEQILILRFDNDTQDYQASKTKALRRNGMLFELFDRKASVYDKILSVFNEPLVVNSKHYTQRQMKIKAHLWNKK